MSAYEFLRWEVGADSIATVWLSRPPVNAVNQVMYREIAGLFGELGADPAVNAMVLAADGPHFCAGNELAEFETLSPENSGERMREVREAFWAIYDCPVPVICAVQGTAVGTGLAIVASCDAVIAAHGARLGVTEIAVGVMGAAKHLSRMMPQGMVRWMFYSGEPLPAEDFLPFGGVLAVVEPGQLLAEARSRAAMIVRHSPLAIRYAKRALNTIEYMELKPGYEYEQGLTGELSGHDDPKEAIRAFFERRPPHFTGR